jgi:hypothetical protein
VGVTRLIECDAGQEEAQAVIQKAFQAGAAV